MVNVLFDPYRSKPALRVHESTQRATPWMAIKKANASVALAFFYCLLCLNLSKYDLPGNARSATDSSLNLARDFCSFSKR